MSKAQVVVGHTQLAKTVTMEIDRDFLTRATVVGHQPSQTALVMQFKRRYEEVHRTKIGGFISWRGINLEETEESKNRPQGCALEDCCAGCDQGHHCHNTARGCYM